MLGQVSWGAFFKVIGVLLVVYYAWIGTKLFRSRKRTSAPPKPSVPQGDLFEPAQSVDEQKSELFPVMEKAISRLKGVVSRGVADHWGEEELKTQIQDVLSGFHHLKRTPYQVAINNFLIRTCISNFSLGLDEGTLENLWK